jgi:RNA polymerase sigma-70 factor (ECF subfamily)
MFGSWFAVLGALMADAAPNPVPAETDRADLDRALQGDGDAFARIVARHQQRVAAHVWPLLRGAGVVEEVVHDTFVEAYLSLASFRGGAALSTWLCGIATRVCYRRMRDRDRRGRRDAAFAREQQRAIAESGETDERATKLWALVDTMPAKDRLVLVLAYAHGLSIGEIATLSGTNALAAKLRLHRARSRLRELMEKESTS